MDTLEQPAAEHENLATSLAEQGAQLALAAWVDVAGRPKSKFVPIDHLPTLLAGSERYTPRGMGDLGQHEPQRGRVRRRARPGHAAGAPWDPRVVFFDADLLFGGTEPFANCPRSILKAVTRRAARLGFGLNLGVETEIYVFRRDRCPTSCPIAPSGSLKPTPAYDVERTLDCLDFLAEVPRHMPAADFGLFSFDHEGGDGQYELDCAHAEALEMSDSIIYFRLLLRHVARKAGLLGHVHAQADADDVGSGPT